MKRLSVFLCVVSTVCLSVAEGATIAAIRDNFIRSGNATSTDPNNNLVLTGNVTASDYIRGLIEFDLSGVTGQESSGSSLTLTITNLDTGSANRDVTLGLYLVTATGVDVNAVTWQNKAPGNSWSGDGGIIGTDFSASPVATLTVNPSAMNSYTTLSFNSALLDAALTGAAASGGSVIFALVSSDEGTEHRGMFRIGSTEETYAANPVPAGPKLEFIPEPSTLLAACMGLTLLAVRRRN